MTNHLPDWTEGTTHLVMQVPWTDANDEVVDLTGATITGLIMDTNSGVSRLITGTLLQDGTVDHYMNWTLTTADAAAGENEVQFTATFATKPVSTFRALWHVEAAIPAPPGP